MILSSRKIFLLAILLSSSTTFAASKQLNNYAQLAAALDSGDDIKAIIHIDQCKLSKNGFNKEYAKSDKIFTSTRINFNIFSAYQARIDGELKNTIATSNTILTEHSLFGPVYAYGRLRVFEDNSAEFHAAYYDPRTYEVRAIINYSCHLGDGEDQGGITLIDASN